MTNGPTLATAMTPEGTLGHELARMFAPPGACVWGQLCMYVCTGIANSPCSWCAGNMCPPRLPPGDRRHLLPGHLLHGCTVAGAGVPRRASTGTGGRCGRAALCAHGRAMPVTRLRVLRQMPHPVPAVCAVLMRGAAVRAPRSGRELVGRSWTLC